MHEGCHGAWPEKIMKEKSYKPQAPSFKLDTCPRDDRMKSELV